MRRLKRTGVYTASNVTYDPLRQEAVSYGWWHFVRRIEGVLVFNAHRYSVTTAAHQRKVRAVMNGQMLTVNTHESLHLFDTIEALNAACVTQADSERHEANMKRVERNNRAREKRAALRIAELTRQAFSPLRLVAVGAA